MSYKLIDMNTYARRAHFDYFRTLPYPYVGITQNVDISPVLHHCKGHQYSFYLTFLHIAALAADDVREFRQRIHENGIIEYDECPTSHIELLDDTSYCYCTLHHHMPFDEYYSQAEAARNKCRKNGITEDAAVESMYFVTSVPWLNYTAVIQPVAGGDESNPRITWGKYSDCGNDKIMMPVSVLAHHALVDGIHIAAFYNNLEKKIQKFIDK